MRILFIGEPGEIQETLGSQLRGQLDAAFPICSFENFSPALIDADVHLIIIGVETPNDALVFDRLLREEPVMNQRPVVVFARDPSGTQVLNWLRMGTAAVELWPCQPPRIAFLADYLTIKRRLSSPEAVNVDVHPQRPAAQPANQVIMASPIMQRLLDQIVRVAPLDSNILFSGETGVGKTKLARLVHDHSRNREAPFIAVNCGALPESLLESELFGHRKGAFTGAEANRKGRFEEVGQGTLFLDEIDSIPLSSQCKLLRAVENRLFEPLGCNQTINFRGRILAASNTQLEELIERGQFRADLYYRLGVVDLYIPPLRERREDIRPIAEATLVEYASRNRLSVKSFSEGVLTLLERYAWPGNVRQLKNVVESSASLCRGEQIEISDLSGRWVADAVAAKTDARTAYPSSAVDRIPSSSVEQGESSLAASRARLEVDRIRSALSAVGNNRTKAAIQLGISRTMLYKKIAKYGLANHS